MSTVGDSSVEAHCSTFPFKGLLHPQPDPTSSEAWIVGLACFPTVRTLCRTLALLSPKWQKVRTSLDAASPAKVEFFDSSSPYFELPDGVRPRGLSVRGCSRGSKRIYPVTSATSATQSTPHKVGLSLADSRAPKSAPLSGRVCPASTLKQSLASVYFCRTPLAFLANERYDSSYIFGVGPYSSHQIRN